MADVFRMAVAVKVAVGLTEAVPNVVLVVVSVKVTVPVGPEIPGLRLFPLLPPAVKPLTAPNVAVSCSGEPEVICVSPEPTANVPVAILFTVKLYGPAVVELKLLSPE
jgi:hypothetical protein